MRKCITAIQLTVAAAMSLVLLTAATGQFHLHAATLTVVPVNAQSSAVDKLEGVSDQSRPSSLKPAQSASHQDYRDANELICGDADASGDRDIADIVYLINYVFSGGGEPQDSRSGDYDCDGGVSIADAVLLVNWIFDHGPAPCSGAECGVGILLAGDPDSLAVAATIDFGPIAADSAEIDSTGLFLTRISATIHPEATVGEINAALTSIEGRISFMNPQDLDITVAIAPVANRAEADSLAAILVQSGAFLFAFSEYQPSLNGASGGAELPPNGTAFIDHLLKQRMPAAWNAKGRAEQVNQVVTVFVPDGYRSQTPHPEIPSQTFVTGGGKPDRSASEGNHGFSVCGIIGSRHDAVNTTGIHPLDQLLSIRSMLTGGQTMNEMCDQIATLMPAGRFVLNTSLGYIGNLEETPKLVRVRIGMEWRKLVLQRKDDFIHVATAGNEGQNTDESFKASLGSPWNVAAAFASPFDAFSPGELGPIDSTLLQIYWNYLVDGNPFMEVKLNNVLVVGSSDTTGSPSAFSCPVFGMGGFSVRALGEDVVAPCVRPGDGCASVSGFLQQDATGTSFAAPQVAGLAAYMLNLDPTLSNNEIKDIIKTAYEDSPNQGFVDAYAAVLAVDPTLADANVRFALLDVADAAQNEIPDNVFDEHDIQLFLTKFAEYEQIRDGIPNAPADYSRFDLNGDGFTGGTSYVSKFDLDINYPAQYKIVTVLSGGDELSLDENTLVDLDILCYYANTPLYTGNDSIKTELLVDCPCAQVESREAQCGGCELPMNEALDVLDRRAFASATWETPVFFCDVDSFSSSDLSTGDWIDALEVVGSCPQSADAFCAFDISMEFDSLQSKWTYRATALLQAENTAGSGANNTFAIASIFDRFSIVFNQIDSCPLQFTAQVKVTARSGSSNAVPSLVQFTFGDFLQFERSQPNGLVIDTTIAGDLVSDLVFTRLYLQTVAGEGKDADMSCELSIVIEPKPTAAKARIRSNRAAHLPEPPLLQTPAPAKTNELNRRISPVDQPVPGQ